MGKTAPQKTAVVYVRTSTSRQKEAATIEAQVERCKQLVAAHGVKLIAYGKKADGWIRDDGVSGSLLEGRAFAQLIDDLESGRVRVDYLVTYSMSRLARHDKASKDMAKLVKSATDKARIMAVLNGARVKIVDNDGENDPASVMTEIKETLSGEEYRAIRKRTMDGKARTLANGAWATGGRVPYGYKRVFVNGRDRKQGTTLAPDAEDGPRLLAVMRQYVQEGAASASRYAIKQGWPSPRGSETWYPSTIQQLLNNLRAYRGETTLSIDGTPYEVKYPALMDAKTYAAVEQRRRSRSKERRTTLLGTYYVDCGTCGGHVHGYRSSTREHYHATCRPGRCVRMREDAFAAGLWELCVARLVQIAEAEKPGVGKDPSGSKIEAVRTRLSDAQARIERVVALYAEGTIDKAALNTQNEKLRDEKASIQAEIERLQRDRDARERRKHTTESVYTRVQIILRKLRTEPPALKARRKILADLLQGERAIVTAKETRKSKYYELRLPAFGSLAPVTVRLDRDITTQLHGVSREVLDLYYRSDDIVEHVSL